MNSAEERKEHDEKKMCKDYGKRMLLCPIPFVIGAVIDYVFTLRGMSYNLLSAKLYHLGRNPVCASTGTLPA